MKSHNKSHVDSLSSSSEAALIPGVWDYQNLFDKNSSVLGRVPINVIHTTRLLEAVVQVQT